MLILAKKISEIDFRRLMEIYVEGCLEKGSQLAPEESRDRQIALGQEDFYGYLTEVFFTEPEAVYAIWKVNGNYVSALRLEPYRDGLLLEALETHPEHRRRGYARELICAVLARHPDRRIYSHVHKQNIPSLGVHEACGFRRILDYAVYINGSVNDRCCTLCHGI